MIAYVDSSVLARAYLAGEVGHQAAVDLLADPETGLVTGSWTLIEVSGALVRAAQQDVEEVALQLVRRHGLRAMDAWHLAAATLVSPALCEPGEEMAFATRNSAQAAVAGLLGLRTR